MKELLAQLGVVCEGCSSWNPPGQSRCSGCGAHLETAAWIHGSTPAPQTRYRLLPLRCLGITAGVPLPLVTACTTVGRRYGELRFPADTSLAPRAATFHLRLGRLSVRNEAGDGLFVRLRGEKILAPGACFAVGDQLLRFAGILPPPEPEADGLLAFGSPHPGPAIRVEQLHFGGRPGAAWVVNGTITIGRVHGQILFPDDPFVSGRHCELEPCEGGVRLRDLGSSNGTFVEVEAGREHELQPGDLLRIGRNILRLEAELTQPESGTARFHPVSTPR